MGITNSTPNKRWFGGKKSAVAPYYKEKDASVSVSLSLNVQIFDKTVNLIDFINIMIFDFFICFHFKRVQIHYGRVLKLLLILILMNFIMQQNSESKHAFGIEHILIIEDSMRFIKTLTSLLKNIGPSWVISVADCCHAGFSKLKESNFVCDAIFIEDCNEQFDDEIDICDFIKKIRARLPKNCIIIVTTEKVGNVVESL